MGKVRRGAHKATAKKNGGSSRPKSSGVIKRTSVHKEVARPKKQPGKKAKPFRVAHKHHSKEALFEPAVSSPLALSAED